MEAKRCKATERCNVNKTTNKSINKYNLRSKSKKRTLNEDNKTSKENNDPYWRLPDLSKVSKSQRQQWIQQLLAMEKAEKIEEKGNNEIGESKIKIENEGRIKNEFIDTSNIPVLGQIIFDSNVSINDDDSGSREPRIKRQKLQ
eukprot:425673_1